MSVEATGFSMEQSLGDLDRTDIGLGFLEPIHHTFNCLSVCDALSHLLEET